MVEAELDSASTVGTNVIKEDYMESKMIEHNEPTAFKLIRQLTGYNSNEFAARAGISAPYWSQLESGSKVNPSDQVIDRIAQTCGVGSSTIRALTSTEMAQNIPEFKKYLFAAVQSYITSIGL